MIKSISNKKRCKKTTRSIISTKYQIVIPKEVRLVVNDVKPGTEVYITPIDKRSMRIELKTKSWIDEIRGIVPPGTYGPDPVKYVKKIRSELEERLEKLEKLRLK